MVIPNAHFLIGMAEGLVVSRFVNLFVRRVHFLFSFSIPFSGQSGFLDKFHPSPRGAFYLVATRQGAGDRARGKGGAARATPSFPYPLCRSPPPFFIV